MDAKDWQSACNVCLEGCIHHPCVSLWLCAGMSFIHLGDEENAELALSEANILDNRHPVVWGYLALISLKAGRSEESKLVMLKQKPVDLGCAVLFISLLSCELGNCNSS